MSTETSSSFRPSQPSPAVCAICAAAPGQGRLAAHQHPAAVRGQSGPDGLEHPRQWNYFFTLLLALPAAGLYVRTFIIQHDCGHGSFFASRKADHMVGAALGVVTLFPYGYWKKTHAIHHATSGNLDRREFGDVRTLTVEEYLKRSPLQRFGYRLYRSAPVLFLVGPFYQFVLKHRIPFDLPFAWKREWASVLWNNLVLGLLLWGLIATIGWKTLLLVELPILLVAGALGIWLFYVQHQFEDAYWERQDAWDAEPPRSRAARSTTCRASCIGSPATSVSTTSTIWRARSRTTVCARRSSRARRCRAAAPVDPRELPLRPLEALGRRANRMVGFPKRQRASA